MSFADEKKYIYKTMFFLMVCHHNENGRFLSRINQSSIQVHLLFGAEHKLIYF